MTKNRLKNHICYLCGSIDQSADIGRGWRDDITPFLNGLDIGVFNPCDKPINNTKVQEDDKFVEHINELKKLGYYAHAQREMQEVVRIDLKLVDLSNFLILNIVPDVHMCGSYAEQTLACFQRKPIIVHCATGIHKVPNWLFGICDPELFFSDWKSVRGYITDIATGETVNDNDSKWRFLDYDKVFGRKVVSV